MPFNYTDPDTGITTYGLSGYTYQEVLKKLNDNVIANINEETGGSVTTIDTSEETPLGKWHAIIAERIVNLYNEGLSIQNSFSRNTATGASLNKIALLSGTKKEQATFTQGDLRLFGEEDTFVEAGSSFSNLKGDIFNSTEDVTLSSDKCFSADIKVLLAKPTKEYYININSIQYSITSSGSPTHYSILAQLDTALSSNVLINTTLSSDLGEDSFLHIEKIDQSSYISILSSALLDTYNIEDKVFIIAEESGNIFGDADTIINIESTVPGLTSVNNIVDLDVGDEAETDEDLREKIVDEYVATGSSTRNSIENRLNRLSFVKSAKVYENRTFETNVDGVPPKNFETIVFHEGDDADIAQTILGVKPLGIDSFGTSTVSATDPIGNSVDIKFTNAEVVYLHVKVDIVKTSEETYPTDGDDLIKASVTLAGDDYEIGEDVFGKRFYGSVFTAVDGVATVDIQVYADSVPITDQGSIVGWTSVEAIGRDQIALFATNRVFVNDLT